MGYYISIINYWKPEDETEKNTNENLELLNVTGFNTSQVKSMSKSFYGIGISDKESLQFNLAIDKSFLYISI